METVREALDAWSSVTPEPWRDIVLPEMHDCEVSDERDSPDLACALDAFERWVEHAEGKVSGEISACRKESFECLSTYGERVFEIRSLIEEAFSLDRTVSGYEALFDELVAEQVQIENRVEARGA